MISRRSTRHVLVWLAAPLVVVLACGEDAPPEKPVARPVKILELGGEGASRILEYPGQVGAAQHADMGFEVAGRIIEFPVQEGDDVEAGQVLAKLDPSDYDADLDAERAKRNAARAEFDRQQALFDADVSSVQELDRAKRNFEVTQANLRQSEKAVADTQLVAPFAGRVARKLVRDFRNVQAKEPVLTLVDESGLEIVANIPERDWALARPGAPRGSAVNAMRPRVTVSTFPDHVFPAQLKEVATTADPTTRTYAVTFSFERPTDINVMPGMTAKLALEVSEAVSGAGYALPARAVVGDQGTEPYVWKVDPDAMTVAQTTVTLGELTGDVVEVRSGLRPGDWIATSGVHQLREGMQVRRFQEQAGSAP